MYNAIAANGGGLILNGVPDGTYNLITYDDDAGFHDRGATVTVHAANGDQTEVAVNASDTAFTPFDNSLLFTNVMVSGGTLLVDIAQNKGEAEFNGAQLQLLSYSATITTNSPSVLLNTTNGTATVSWSQGIIQTSTNVTGPWTSLLVPSPISVNTTTNSHQFFRLKVE